MKHKLLLLLLPAILLVSVAKGQQKTKTQPIQLKEGDLIFQNLACGPLCDAINAVTQGYKGNKFSHMGMVTLRNDSVLIIEASGKDVHVTPLKNFLSKSAFPHYVGRLKPPYQKLIPKAIAFSMLQMGVAYDDQYLYDN